MCDKSLWWEIKILSRVEDGLEGAGGADMNLGVGDCAGKWRCEPLTERQSSEAKIA